MNDKIDASSPFLYQRIGLDSPMINEIFRLRFHVYCTECGFEDPADHPLSIERDVYDDHSCHFAILENGSSEIIGTVRLVFDSENKFPIEKHMQVDPRLLPDVHRSKIGEISRLAISKDYRKRLIDSGLYALKEVALPSVDENNPHRKNFESQLVAGLYQCVYQESISRGLTHWYAAMARGLHCLLRRWGISWTPIGPEMDYHGLRRAYFSEIAKNVEMARKRYPQMLSIPNGWNGESN